MNRLTLAVILAHLGATTLMTGLIWFVQVVHYPLFGSVPEAGFQAYEQAHVARTGLVVGPLMLIELVTAAILIVAPPAGVDRWIVVAGAILLGVVWASTAGLQVPMHRRLESGLDLDVVDRLVSTNWVRTVAWSMRAILATWIVVAACTNRAP